MPMTRAVWCGSPGTSATAICRCSYWAIASASDRTMSSRRWWRGWAATSIGSRRRSIQSPAPMPAAITTTTMMRDRHLLHLLAWLSPAFPTGAYAYSHGLEWAVECGDITDGDTLRAWLADVLIHGSGRNDAILLRHAHRTACDHSALNDLAAAIAPSRERRTET